MYDEEHYVSKIKRNQAVLDKAPKEVRTRCLIDIEWAIALTNRLSQLDYTEREVAIRKMHQVLDTDYISMGFELSVPARR